MECSWIGTASSSKPGEDPTEVVVYFGPTPGSERVIAVSVWRSFTSPQSVKAVLDTARTKYAVEPTLASTSPHVYLAWRFDGRDRIMSEEAATRAHFLDRAVGISLPPHFFNTNGVGIDVDVERDPHHEEISRGYSVSLYRASDLFNFADQAQAAYAAAEKKRKEQELEKANGTGAKIKM